MDPQFASIQITNATRLCIGSITERESLNLQADGINDDGRGMYLFLASDAAPNAPIEILGKFFSPLEAARLAELLPA